MTFSYKKNVIFVFYGGKEVVRWASFAERRGGFFFFWRAGVGWCVGLAILVFGTKYIFGGRLLFPVSHLLYQGVEVKG
jgi:hypothetical protein